MTGTEDSYEGSKPGASSEAGRAKPRRMGRAILGGAALVVAAAGFGGWTYLNFAMNEAPPARILGVEAHEISAPVPTAGKAQGALPMVGLLSAGANPAWRRYSAPVSPEALQGPQLAIVLGGAGKDLAALEAAMRLDAPVTLSIAPNAQTPGDLAKRALAAGHECLLELPMEDADGSEPGPNAISTRLDAQENARRLAAHLGAYEGYVGVRNLGGGAATADPNVMRGVIAGLKKEGLLFLDAKTASRSFGWPMAKRMKVPAAFNQVRISPQADARETRERLDIAAEAARQYGASVAIAELTPETVEGVAAWIKQGGRKGVAIVPITAVAQKLAGRR